MDKDIQWIFIIFIFVSFVYYCHGMYSIKAPASQTAFSNMNITVNYTIGSPTAAIIEMIDINRNQSLHRSNIPSLLITGSVEYPCNMFQNESRLIFLILDSNETVLAQSDILHVQAPSIGVVIPSPQLYTLKGPVDVNIFMNLDGGLCFSERELVFVAKYRRYNDNKSEQMEIYSENINYQLESSVVLGCEYLDTAGYYTFLITTNTGQVLATSATMEVLWNPGYAVHVPTQSTSACPTNGLFIYHQAPDCGKANDKIRVYAQTSSYSATAGPIGSMVYIMEVDMPSVGYDTTIDCSYFEQHYTSYNGYCFFYVSVTRTGAVHEQAYTCIPYLSSDISISGGWSEWGEWSTCTASCGNGSRHRTRACENPPPSNGGAACEGDYVNTGTCNSNACPAVIPTTKEDIDVSCSCGCVLESTSGIIDAYDEDCGSYATWLIRVDSGHRINMTFKSFDLSSSGRYQEYLRIRDGVDSKAPILLFVTGTRLPVPVLSSGEAMYMEYQIYRSNTYRHGFLASFNSTKKENVKNATNRQPVLKNPNNDQFSGSAIMMAGIFTCVIVILVTITAVTYIYIKSGLMLDCIRKIKPRIKSEFAIPSEQDKCSPIHRPYKSDIPSDMDDRGNPDGNVCDRSHMYLAKEDHSNSNEFPRRLISIDSDDCRKDPLGQDQSFTGAVNATFDDRFPDGPRNNRYSFHSDGSRSSRFQDLQIRFTMREGPSGFSRQTSFNSCDSSNTLPSNFQFSAPYVNREGNLTPLGFAISRSLSLNQEKVESMHDGEKELRQRSQSTCGIGGMPESHLLSSTDVCRQGLPTSAEVVIHSEKAESDARSPTSRVSRKLPVTPRPAFYEFQIEQPEVNSPQHSATPTRQKNGKTRRLSSNKNTVMTINEEPHEGIEAINSETMSPSDSFMTRESPPGGPVRRLKQKAAKRQRKSTECLSSAESDMRLSQYSTSSQDCMFSDDQPSPIRKYDANEDKQMWRHVFLSDESLSKTISGNEGSGGSSPTRRRLPDTPTKRPNSLNNNQFPSNAELCDGMIIYQEDNELEFDNYMPDIPGSYFEGNFNYPGDLGSDMDLFEGLEISKV